MADMVCAKDGGKMVDGKCEDCGGTKTKAAKPAAKKSPVEKWMGKGDSDGDDDGD